MDDVDRLAPHFFDKFNQVQVPPLPPDVLPPGLRVLVLNDSYTLPLRLGSLPSTLTFLQLGEQFQQPLAPGVLPASLRYRSMNLNEASGALLEVGSLPASLERLRLMLWSPPLEAGLLPAQLEACASSTDHCAPTFYPPPCCTSRSTVTSTLSSATSFPRPSSTSA